MSSRLSYIVDSITDILPTYTENLVCFLKTENRLYSAKDSNWYSESISKWDIVVIRDTGIEYQFDGLQLIMKKVNNCSTISVKDYGAVGDGITDDSNAFIKALADNWTVSCPDGIYLIKNVTINTNNTIIGNGAVFRAAPNADYIFQLTGFKPTLKNCYFDDQLNNLIQNLTVNGCVVVYDATYPSVKNCQFVNMSTGLLLGVSSNTTVSQTTKGSFSDLVFDTISNRGIYVGQNVNTCTFYGIRMYVGVEFPDNRPKRNCIGLQINSQGSLNTFGGHILDKIDVEQADHGFQFSSAQLTQVSNCFADSLSGTGFQVTGNSSDIKFSNCLAGSCLNGFEICDASHGIIIDSANTKYNGVVPPWWVGPKPFYNTGTVYDIAIRNSAKCTVGTWFGDKKVYLDNTATINFESTTQIYSASSSNIPPNTTQFFGPVGSNVSEFGWVMPSDGVITKLMVQSSSEAGIGNGFTYTTRINSVDSAQVVYITGINSYQGTSNTPVIIKAGQYVSVKINTSQNATSTTHRLVANIRYF